MESGEGSRWRMDGNSAAELGRETHAPLELGLIGRPFLSVSVCLSQQPALCPLDVPVNYCQGRDALSISVVIYHMLSSQSDHFRNQVTLRQPPVS